MKISLLRQLPTLILTALALKAPAALDKGWDAPFISGTSQTIGYDIATENGITYSAGFVQTTNNFGYVIAHNDRGVELWARTLTPCILTKIVVAGSFVYACGYTPVNGYDGVVVKLEKATGVPSATWADTGFGVGVRHFGNSVSQTFSSIVVSGATVYLGGYYEVGTNNTDACIAKYDSNGNLSSTWASTGLGVGVRTLAGGGAGVDNTFDIGLDANGNLYATGRLRVSASNADGFVWKLAASNGASSASWPNVGDGVGVRRFGTTTNPDTAYALAIKGSTVTIAGFAGDDAVALQYSAAGTLNWTYTYGDANNQSFHTIVPHASGYYAIGPDGTQGTIVNISDSGFGQSWHGNGGLGINHFENDGSSLYLVVVDPVTGKPYFAGSAFDANNDREIVLYTVNSSAPIFVGRADTASNDDMTGLAIDTTGRISLLGQSNSAPISGLVSRFGFAADHTALEYALLEGFEFDGGLGQMLTSDNQYFRLFNDDLTGRASIEFSAYLPVDQRNPLKLVVQYESAVGRPGLVETFQVRNYTLNLLQTRIGFLAPTSDTIRTSTNSTTPDRDINDSDGQVKIRLTWNPINDEDPSQDGWLHRLDQLSWHVVY